MDEFADKSGTYDLTLRVSEKYIHIHLSDFFKEAFKRISKDLTKTEKRVFIGMYIGMRSFDYRILALDKVIFNFINFDDDSFTILFKFLQKEVSRKDIYLEEKIMFLLKFIEFLNLYPTWAYIVKSYDYEDKKFPYYAQIKDIQNENEFNNLKVKNNIDFSDYGMQGYKSFELKDIFRKLFEPVSAEIIINKYLYKFTQKELADKYKISQPAVSKRIMRCRQGLLKSKEISKIFSTEQIERLKKNENSDDFFTYFIERIMLPHY